MDLSFYYLVQGGEINGKGFETEKEFQLLLSRLPLTKGEIRKARKAAHAYWHEGSEKWVEKVPRAQGDYYIYTQYEPCVRTVWENNKPKQSTCFWP